ncbi:MAG: alpha/beta hydrolase [Nanoarchaeota archaeon]|nr:alpha/beta hydrolase [Nanoarchaeota archaeon]
MEQKFVVVDGLHFSYWDNCVENSEKTVLFLPFAAETGQFAEVFETKLPKNIRIISPDYPGRGKSEKNDYHNTFESMAKDIDIFIREMKINNSILIAASFGTAVANELVKQNTGFEKIILIAPGEFFSIPKKVLFRILFLPANFSERIRKTYLSVIRIFNPSLAKELDKVNLKSILCQWLNTLNYKIDPSHKNNIPTVFINLKKDTIIRKSSKKKLQMLYESNKSMTVNLEHTMDIDKFMGSEAIEKELILKIVKEIL